MLLFWSLAVLLSLYLFSFNSECSTLTSGLRFGFLSPKVLYFILFTTIRTERSQWTVAVKRLHDHIKKDCRLWAKSFWMVARTNILDLWHILPRHPFLGLLQRFSKKLLQIPGVLCSSCLWLCDNGLNCFHGSGSGSRSCGTPGPS